MDPLGGCSAWNTGNITTAPSSISRESLARLLDSRIGLAMCSPASPAVSAVAHGALLVDLFGARDHERGSATRRSTFGVPKLTR